MGIRVLIVVALLSTLAPAAATAQVSLQGGVGTDVNGGGNSLSLSAGFWAGNRIGFLVGAERIHLPTDVNTSDNVSSATRGGTSTFFSGEVRWLPFTLDRVSPYLLAGGGAGRSRPNVNEIFPDAVRNSVTVLFGGGGVHVPVSDHLSVFADMRLLLQLERDSPYLFLPVRGGLLWRF